MTQKTHRRRRIVLATLAVVAIAVGVTLKACAPDKHPQYLSAPVTRGDL